MKWIFLRVVAFSTLCLSMLACSSVETISSSLRRGQLQEKVVGVTAPLVAQMEVGEDYKDGGFFQRQFALTLEEELDDGRMELMQATQVVDVSAQAGPVVREREHWLQFGRQLELDYLLLPVLVRHELAVVERFDYDVLGQGFYAYDRFGRRYYYDRSEYESSTSTQRVLSLRMELLDLESGEVEWVGLGSDLAANTNREYSWYFPARSPRAPYPPELGPSLAKIGEDAARELAKLSE